MSTGNAPMSGAERARLQRAALDRLLAEEGLAASARVVPARADRSESPASYSQELLWLLDQSTPDLTAYNGPVARRLRGAVAADALERALDRLVQRHDALRTTFHPGGEHPVQRVEPAAPFRLTREELRGVAAAERERTLATRMTEEARRRFDLRRDRLLRASLYRLGESEWVLHLVSHHIVMDGWSLGVLFRELSVLYAADRAGAAAELPALPITFGDYATWQRATATGSAMEPHLASWRSALSGTLPVLELPTDHARPIIQGFAGRTARIVIAPVVLDGLKRLAQANGASIYMVLVAGYQALLHRWSGQDDIIIGSPAAGRPLRDTEGLIGYFNNPLVIRTGFADDPSFADLLARVRETCLHAYEHQELPFELLVLDLQQSRPASHAPLFRAVLTMQETHAQDLELPGVSVDAVAVEHGSVKFDLTLLTSEHPDGLHFDLEYRTDLFEPPTADRFLGHLATLLAAAAAAPGTRVSALPILTATERAALTGWNATTRDLGEPTTMAAMIATAGSRRGGQAAIVCGSAVLTWNELLTRAAQLAHHLQSLGTGPGDSIGLCAERSAELMVGMAGILLSGAAYVPLLPDQPAARIARQLETSGARRVVTLSRHRALVPPGTPLICLDTDAAVLAALPFTVPACGATPDSPAYVLFTSGSTGEPKGVLVTHGNLVHYTRAIAARLGLELGGGSAGWHCATVSTLGADLGHTAVFPALASGGTLHVLPEDVVLDAVRFQQYVAAHPLDLLKITPSHLQALAGPEFLAEHMPRRWLVVGGEPCPWSLVDAVQARARCRILNHYGPTETTVGATTFEPAAGTPRPATVPIGGPLPNATAHVLDGRGSALPVGIPGELWIGGQGVAPGYVGRDDLTRERFVTVDGERRYRTGDRVRRLASGDLEFLGRLDTQVKVRGHRVELGEIEAALSRIPSVRQAVVAFEEGGLVGFVVPAGAPTPAMLSDALAATLPAYMVPQSWIFLERIPLTANGKVDRAALPLPAATNGAAATDSGDGMPKGDTETKLAALWAEVLKRPQVGRHQNFFEMGGHSLLAIRLLGRIAKAFGPRLPLRTLFERPTIAMLAEALGPSNPVEGPLAELWSEVLKRDRVSRDENFFELGGHSLLAIRMLGKVAKQFGVRLSLRTLFEAPTLAQLALRIQEAAAPAGAAP